MIYIRQDLPSVTVRVRGRTAYVDVHGSCGILEAGSVRQALKDSLACGVDTVLVDLDGLGYMRSVAVTAILVDFAKHCPSHVRVKLLALLPEVKKVLVDRGLWDLVRTDAPGGLAIGGSGRRSIPVSEDTAEEQAVTVVFAEKG